MIRILFVCHGNICRSPMAEFVMKDLVAKRGMAQQFAIESAATSAEELGNPVHSGTRQELAAHGIGGYESKRARRLTRADYQKFDLIVAMDNANVRNIRSLVGGDPKAKVHKLLEFAGSTADVADPWYTGDFATTYDDVCAGCEGLLHWLALR